MTAVPAFAVLEAATPELGEAGEKVVKCQRSREVACLPKIDVSLLGICGGLTTQLLEH